MNSRENEMLTRTGQATAMGELLRRFWIPAFLSEEIAAPDCPPIRVRLLGQDFVAFRDSAGGTAGAPATLGKSARKCSEPSDRGSSPIRCRANRRFFRRNNRSAASATFAAGSPAAGLPPH